MTEIWIVGIKEPLRVRENREGVLIAIEEALREGDVLVTFPYSVEDDITFVIGNIAAVL